MYQSYHEKPVDGLSYIRWKIDEFWTWWRIVTKVNVSCESNMNDIVDKTYLYDQTVRILGNSWLSSCCDFFFEHRYSDLESTLINIYTKCKKYISSSHRLKIANKMVFHSLKISLVIVCLFVLFLYVPTQQLWSWRDGQFTKPPFFLDKLEQAVNTHFRL